MKRLLRKFSALKDLAVIYVGTVLAYIKADKPASDRDKIQKERDDFSQQLQLTQQQEDNKRHKEKMQLQQRLAQQLASTSNNAPGPNFSIAEDKASKLEGAASMVEKDLQLDDASILRLAAKAYRDGQQLSSS